MKLAGYRLKTAEGRRLKPAPKTAAEHYQTPEHRAWRAEVLRRAMFCCQHPGCTATAYTARLFADHIVELKDGGAALDPENGQALCGKHHTVKTMRERAKRAKA
ncbi:HNH endonuclease signature motif containing protein [Methylopila sp. 73B]|uniref:HNH endonuclease signature motif containing protein n=1 Tax=Methylopila sp. 73B TaxID=1120792 RepID=UPI000376A52F|nr:HNH endonuclease signature motif containing protein [Methylopila sp. 73B]